MNSVNQSVFDFDVRNNRGELMQLKQFQGKVLLIVNTASKCGFTPQYKGLEALHKKYAEQGLVVIGFPCDQFGHQEPGNNAEIAQFCEINFGVTFSLMAKIDVNGSNADPLFVFLKDKAPGLIFKKVKWNFTKFLVDSSGQKVKRFSSLTKPESLEKAIEKLLKNT